MKKYINMFMVAIFATMTFVLISCGDDDEPTNNIEGTWMEIDAPYSDGPHYVQFNSDKSYYEVNIYKDEIDVLRGTWKLDGNSIVIHSNDLGIDFSADLNKVSSNELVVTMLSIRQTYKRVSDSEINKYLK